MAQSGYNRRPDDVRKLSDLGDLGGGIDELSSGEDEPQGLLWGREAEGPPTLRLLTLPGGHISFDEVLHVRLGFPA